MKIHEQETVPQGLQYIPNFLSEDEQIALVDNLERFSEEDWARLEIKMMGVVASRKIICYGANYITKTKRLSPAPPIPDWLKAIRVRAAQAAQVDCNEFEQVIVSRYPPGAGIGWHSDKNVFGDVVLGVSLLSACRMFFRREGFETYRLKLEPRSLLIMSGEARWQWQHQIPGTSIKSLRYSLTFRSFNG